MSHQWDPELYLRYGDERGRPFLDLLARVLPERPSSVVDLGCGPGTLTAHLKRRWPEADVLGIDSSPEMIAAADHSVGVRFQVADLREWRPRQPADVLISNATLQWVPGHLELLPALLHRVADGGWLAFQVPGNFDEPSHTIRAELAADPRYASHLEGVASPQAHGPSTYLERLLDLGCEVDAWETTYLHLLHGEDPVFTWAIGTGARPTLQALPEGVRQEFEEEFRQRLRSAYPRSRRGTVLPFRRVFVVARKGART